MDRSVRHVPPPDPDLEQEADRLLVRSALAHGRGPYPFYAEPYLLRRIRRDNIMASTQEPLICRTRPAEPPLLGRLMAAAPLTCQERGAIEQLCSGERRAAIARRLGVTRARVTQLLRSACAKMRAAREAGRTRPTRRLTRRDIVRCFDEDEHRFVYRLPVCCQEGYEACRQTGLCDRRWYLFV